MIFPSLWSKIFIEFFLLLLFILVIRTQRVKAVSIFGYIIAVLTARDILFAFFPLYYIFSVSDFIVISLYLLWIRSYTGRRRTDNIFFILNILFFGVTVTNYYLNVLNIPLYFLNLTLIADIIYIALSLGLVSEYNTEESGIILKSRYTVIIVFSLFNLIALLYGYQNEIIQQIIVPASYFIHAYVLYLYITLLYSDKDKTINFLSSNLESMFDFMKNFGNALTNKIDLEQILTIIVSSAVHNIGADAGAILMLDEYEDKLNVKATYGVYPPVYETPDVIKVKASSVKRYFSATPIALGQTILGEAVQSGNPVFIHNTVNDERMHYNTGDDILFISSIIAVPLIVSGRILGVLSTVKRIENHYFSERDLEHLKTFADAASVTIDNLYTYMEVLEKREIEQEVDTAAEIQQKLIPSDFPEIPHLSLAALNKPAKGVSGDYFDIVKFNNGQVGVFICDVAGKGIPAALVMIMIRTILRLIVATRQDPATILTWINRGLAGSISMDHFATLSFLTFDPEKREIVYSNAAHLPMLIFKNKNSKFVQVDTPGLPVGVEKGTRYAQRRFTLEKDDFMVLYTDGIVETMDTNGKQYSIQSLLNVLKTNQSLSAEQLVNKIKSELTTFAGRTKQHDDQTLLIMKLK